jgi:MFS family permease
MSVRNPRDSRVASADQRARASATLAAVIACVAAFKGLNESVTPPALPILQEQFQVPGSTIAWVITGVLLTGTITTPIMSRLGEVWDKRRALLGVLAIVSLGTLISALSMSIEMLIVGQLMQGVGLSTVPLAIGIIRDTQSEARTKFANGLMVGAIFGSTAVGTMVAGPIADHLSYRWLFWIPFIALFACMVAVWSFVPRSLKSDGARPGIDVSGSVLLAVGLACILLGLTFAPGWGWLSTGVLLLFAAGLTSLAFFARLELRVDNPLIDLRLMRSFTVVAASGLMFLAGYCINATLICVAIQAQLPRSTGYGLGETATFTSIILVSAMMLGLSAPLVSMLDRGIGSRLTSLLGPISILTGAVLMLMAGRHGSILAIVIVAMLMNFGITVSMTQSLNLVVTGVPAEKVTEFNGLNFAIQAVAGTIGAQVSGAVLTVDGAAADMSPPWSGFAVAWGVSGAIAIVVLALVLSVRTSTTHAL